MATTETERQSMLDALADAGRLTAYIQEHQGFLNEGALNNWAATLSGEIAAVTTQSPASAAPSMLAALVDAEAALYRIVNFQDSRDAEDAWTQARAALDAIQATI